MAQEFLSPDQLAEMLGVPVRSVYHWMSEGGGPPSVKLGRHRRFRRSDVEAWIDERIESERSATA